jgi:hypothetical protein
MRPSHERLLDAIGAEWESATLLADRASVNSKAAALMHEPVCGWYVDPAGSTGG